MILGIEGYGSDDDSDSETRPDSQPKPSPVPKVVETSKTSTFSLPPPLTKKRAPKKIAITLPSLSPRTHEGDDDGPIAKKPRLDAGAGASSLLSMLPAPKQKNPVAPPSERVLGGGNGPGLTFSTPRSLSSNTTILDEDNDIHPVGEETHSTKKESPQHSEPSLPFLPSSLKKGRSNISIEDTKPKETIPQQARSKPTADFFSLGNSSASTSKVTLPTSSALPQLSSAPVIPTFEPPEPSQNDPYPGYYQLPSGSWAAHDPAYFAQYVKKWESEYNAHVRALEKGMVKGFEGLESAAVEEVDAMKEMEKAKIEIRDREERKAITQGAGGGPIAPKMNINASKLSGIARSRHQLSTLLKEAYENREALEEKIAQGRRNRKEAGNKYGF